MQAGRNNHKRQACLRCRASKVRCDFVDSKDEICSRCRQSNAVCEIAPLHRRFDKSRKDASTKRSVPSLRPVPSLPSATKQDVPRYTENVQSGQEMLTEVIAKTDAMTQGDSGAVSTSSPAAAKARNLDGLFLDGPTITMLFNKFITEYLQAVPFLESPLEPDAYYNKSTLLFWSIITVAARRSELDSELVVEITRRAVALGTSMSNTASINVVESLILLLSWWLPTIGTIAETPSVLVGTMLHLAIRMGLHNPIRSQDYVRVRLHLTSEDLAHREDLWLHTILLYQKYWSISGTPCEAFSKLGPDPHTTPSGKHNLFTYQRALLDVTTSCLEVLARESQKAEAGEAVHIDSHIKLADERLIRMRPADSGGQPSFETLYWAISRLLIYSHHLHQPLQSPTETTLELYHASSSVLTLMLNLAQYTPHFPTAGTLYEFQCSIIALSTILRLTKLPSFAALIDKESSDALLEKTVQLQIEFACGTRHINIASRLGLMVRLIGSSDVVFRDEKGQLCLELRIKTSGPLSVLHDCAWWVRQLVDPRMGVYSGKVPAYMRDIKAGEQGATNDVQSFGGAADKSANSVALVPNQPITNNVQVSGPGLQVPAAALTWSDPAPMVGDMSELALYGDPSIEGFDWDIFDSIFWGNA